MRIICLSADSADICARLGVWNEVVAVSAFAPQYGVERRPVISGFSTADTERIANLSPDLVITFSDVQAEISARLIQTGLTVLATNQRTLAEIAFTIRLIGGAIGRSTEAEALTTRFEKELKALRSTDEPRPRVYFEEWPDPLISGITWVGELIELTGGIDIFSHCRAKAARERIVTSEEITAADPQIILASWCGKSVDVAALSARVGFDGLSAVRSGEVHEIESDIILQPGPRLLEGADRIRKIIDAWRGKHGGKNVPLNTIPRK